MNQFITEILARAIVGLFFGAIGYIIAVFLINLFVMPFTKAKELRKAREQGRVVTAKFVKSISSKGVGTAGDPEWGIYEYEYNGKKYKYKYLYLSSPIEETLYFKRNPKKATNEVNFGKMECGKLSLYLILSFVSFVVSWFVM